MWFGCKNFWTADAAASRSSVVPCLSPHPQLTCHHYRLTAERRPTEGSLKNEQGSAWADCHPPDWLSDAFPKPSVIGEKHIEKRHQYCACGLGTLEQTSECHKSRMETCRVFFRNEFLRAGWTSSKFFSFPSIKTP